MRLSIVMATWMGEKYLKAQLQSFLDQSRLPDELIVRDDGSNDRTLSILGQFSERAPFPVRIFDSGARLGFAANFGAALSRAQGDLIFLSDQDDVWFPRRLETILRIAKSNSDKLLFINDVENVDASLRRTGVTKLGNIRSSGLSDDRYITGCATAVKKSLLGFALPLPQGLASHDHWLHECAHWLGVRLVIPDVLQYYRRHDTNASGLFISRPRRTGKPTAYMETLRSDALRSHRQLLLMTREIYRRITRSPERVRQLTKTDLSRLPAALETRVQALEGRIKVLEAPWPRRLPAALEFCSRGGYRAFLGWKSLVRDLMNRS